MSSFLTLFLYLLDASCVIMCMRNILMFFLRMCDGVLPSSSCNPAFMSLMLAAQ